ncbi:hypothetical protein GCM10022631_11730 [Deinococcus rubellus]|uniref:Phage protein n=1 Tax=Deinococcus rubellus TaxID=1889240 RepID=A0ABY5YEG6_9DEIO|nr:hypothetical protein [Deinococcus rubellus]UWX62782.1 hypothetical protein N0D28_08345 [Deinococcus rubellus]
MKKHYRYDGEATGFLPGIGSVEPGTVIEATSDSHEAAIKASGHFKLDRPHKEEAALDKPKAEPKAEDSGKGGKK